MNRNLQRYLQFKPRINEKSVEAAIKGKFRNPKIQSRLFFGITSLRIQDSNVYSSLLFHIKSSKNLQVFKQLNLGAAQNVVQCLF